MLVLSRKIEESIRIGDNIVVKVLGIMGGKVSLGIQAPTELRISRTDNMKDSGESDDKRPN